MAIVKNKMMSDGIPGYMSTAKNGIRGWEPLRSWDDVTRLKDRDVDTPGTHPSKKALDVAKSRHMDLVWVCITTYRCLAEGEELRR